MINHDQNRQTIALLKPLILRAAASGLPLGHAQRFFDVGEWFLAYDEIVHIPETDGLAAFKADNAAIFRQLDAWFDRGELNGSS
jgi:hypothetical protein